jgi:ABC-type branched-subunit amino acid transport system ATPase component
MELCQHIIVLDHGQKIAEGIPSEIQNNPLVLEAYLGSTQNANARA